MTQANDLDLSERLVALAASAARRVAAVETRGRPPASAVLWSQELVLVPGHAVERDEEATVHLPGGQTVQATPLGREPTTDLAVLKAAVEPEALQWAAPQRLAVGRPVLVVGRRAPGPSASLALIATAGEGWRGPGGGRIDAYVELDRRLISGMSGALVVDLDGAALGLATSGLVRGRSLLLPQATLERVVQRLTAQGGLRRGFLGISAYPVPLPAELEQAHAQKGALFVASVSPEGPARKAGVLFGDVLLKIDGHPLSEVGELVGYLEEDKIDREVTLSLLRAHQAEELKVRVGARSVS